MIGKPGMYDTDGKKEQRIEYSVGITHCRPYLCGHPKYDLKKKNTEVDIFHSC